MTHEITPPTVPLDLNTPFVPNPSLGEGYGFIDGQFAVARNVYDIEGRATGQKVMDEGGWSFANAFVKPDAAGNSETWVTIINPQIEAEKTVRLATLEGWQPKTEIKDNNSKTQHGLGALASPGSVEVESVRDMSPGEKAKEERLSLLFEPLEKQYLAEADDSDFDFGTLLFSGTDAEYDKYIADKAAIKAQQAATPEAQKAFAMAKRAAVTEKSLQDAELTLRTIQSDPFINSAIMKYKERVGGRITEHDVMAALRSDPDLRLSVGSRLLERANADKYGVRASTQKSPNTPGYAHIPNLQSSEYVALLMLSMADGTFKKSMEDAPDRDKFGIARTGLHRDAARNILRNFNGNL